MRLAAFDIETATLVDNNQKDINYGITCASIVTTGGDNLVMASGLQEVIELSDYPMVEDEIQPRPWGHYETVIFVDALQSFVLDGYKLVSWNGLSFDFPQILFNFRTSEYDTESFFTIRELALGHIDLMFQFFQIKSYPIGLDSACKGMGLRGKPTDFAGNLAPQEWRNGNHKRVLEYVLDDSDQLLRLTLSIIRNKRLSWFSKSGKIQNAYKGFEDLLTVRNILSLPEPTPAPWMDNPIRRRDFSEWIGI